MNSRKKHCNFLKNLSIFVFLSSFLFFVIFEFSFYRLGEIGNYAEIINQQKINQGDDEKKILYIKIYHFIIILSRFQV